MKVFFGHYSILHQIRLMCKWLPFDVYTRSPFNDWKKSVKSLHFLWNVDVILVNFA